MITVMKYKIQVLRLSGGCKSEMLLKCLLPMGDEYAVVALCELLLPTKSSLFIKWCQIPADQMKYETRDLWPGWLYNQPSDLDPASDHTSPYQDDPRCELTLDEETVTTQ